MRPRGWYAAIAAADLWIICQGHMAARAITGGAHSYFRFRTQQEAEEWSMWWDHDHPLTMDRKRTIIVQKEGA